MNKRIRKNSTTRTGFLDFVNLSLHADVPSLPLRLSLRVTQMKIDCATPHTGIRSGITPSHEASPSHGTGSAAQAEMMNKGNSALNHAKLSAMPKKYVANVNGIPNPKK